MFRRRIAPVNFDILFINSLILLFGRHASGCSCPGCIRPGMVRFPLVIGWINSNNCSKAPSKERYSTERKIVTLYRVIEP